MSGLKIVKEELYDEDNKWVVEYFYAYAKPKKHYFDTKDDAYAFFRVSQKLLVN